MKQQTTMKKSKPSSIETNPLFWDCECDTNYIHLKDNNNNCCDKCNAHVDDGADSRKDEVLLSLLGKNVFISDDHLFAQPEDAVIITINKTDEEENVVWDTLRGMWCTPQYAYKNFVK